MSTGQAGSGHHVGGREHHAVELVDARGRPLGETTVAEAHRAPGMLHRAFSVFLRDPSGRVLLQQRAAVKKRFPLRWANTCCGHPAPGEAPADAAIRRLGEELGVASGGLAELGVYSYRAADGSTDQVEHEYDHVLLGELPAGQTPRPDAGEVADLRWVEVPALLAELRDGSAAHAPWLAGVTHVLARHLGRPGAAR